MRQDRSRHAAPVRRGILRWNRSDLAILLCGFLAFFSTTVGAPLFHAAPLLSAGPVTAIATGGAASGGTAANGTALNGTKPIAVTGAPDTVPGPDQAAPAPPAGTTAAEPAAGPDLPPAAQPVRIHYPSAAVDVVIHPLDLDGEAQSSRTIEPPATKDAYWLTPFGVPGKGSGNTTYVIGHSWEGADAPFNHLSSAAAVGDRFAVETAAGTISYQVESITTYLKSSLKDSPVWDMVPNRLVLISCFTEDPWGKNVVVTAYPAAD